MSDDAELRLKAIEISAGLWRRHIIEGAKMLANGGGNLWSIRKKANHMATEIYFQLAVLGAQQRPKDESKVRRRKEEDGTG